MAAATFGRKSGVVGALRYGVPWRMVVIHVASILIMLWIVLPFAWVVLTSLMTEVESLSKPPHWIPDYITFDNYLAFLNPDLLGTQRLTGGGTRPGGHADCRGGLAACIGAARRTEHRRQTQGQRGGEVAVHAEANDGQRDQQD